MNKRIKEIIEKLKADHSLLFEEYVDLIDNRDEESRELLREYAEETKRAHYGDDIYIRGLIEISNYCKNNCLYCGIRASNRECERYRLTKEEIFSCCEEGYQLGFRTFVLQGGEDIYFNDALMCDIVRQIKAAFPDCALTLSLGERSYDSYKMLKEARADRYLLRHETASKEHYEYLHPGGMSFERRMECLSELKSLGYQVGCGFMVGSPKQTSEDIARDLRFIEEFQPHMCGIGPFIPHHATPFAKEKSGTVELSCYLLSIIRLISPNILLPATTALGSMEEYGREKGIISGANVVMPNLSPQSLRGKYEIYDNKLYSKSESAQALDELKKRIEKIGHKIVCDRGDAKKQ